MSQFVEMHLNDRISTPLIVNVDRIGYIKPSDQGAIIYLATIDVSGQQGNVNSRLALLHVTEDYYSLKELLRCK